jgi:hypothetical protein
MPIHVTLQTQNQIYLFRMAVYNDKDGKDISIHVVDYHNDCADIFSLEVIQTLSKHSGYVHKINIVPDKQAPWGLIISLMETEVKVLK